ncbi:MAG: phosphoribosyltransferase family protein [Candidatus Woykebacteria bacterium]
MLTEDNALELIKSTGAVEEGHFVFTNGSHARVKITKKFNTKPHKLDLLAEAISDHFESYRVEVVISPAAGAIALGSRVAYYLGEETNFIYAEVINGQLLLPSGFADLIREGTRVLVVDDTSTTGGTEKELMRAVRKLGAEVVGVGQLWNRTDVRLDVPIFSCVNRYLPDYPEDECPLCQEGVQINTDDKHGLAFVDRYGNNPSGWPANRK